MKDKCTKCNHKTKAGEPVVPHRVGDLVCPEVQAGNVMAHPRWSKFKSDYKNVKFSKPSRGDPSSSKSGAPTFNKNKTSKSFKAKTTPYTKSKGAGAANAFAKKGDKGW